MILIIIINKHNHATNNDDNHNHTNTTTTTTTTDNNNNILVIMLIHTVVCEQKHSSREEDMWEIEFKEHRIRGWIAVWLKPSGPLPGPIHETYAKTCLMSQAEPSCLIAYNSRCRLCAVRKYGGRRLTHCLFKDTGTVDDNNEGLITICADRQQHHMRTAHNSYSR